MTKALARESVQKKLLLQTLRGEATAEVPFWLMRQAGRYLPEYRALRQKAGGFLDLCFNPDWAAEVTLQPVRRFGMDAAILFSDILVVPYALGQKLSFTEGEGPQLGAFREEGFFEVDTEAFDKRLAPVFEAVKRARQGLEASKALIGFAGAPWTVACYMVEGHGGDFAKARQYAAAHPEKFDRLIATLAEVTSRYLIKQIESGVDTVQIFDSWAGLVPEGFFDRWIIAPTRQIVDTIHEAYPGFPVIGFPRQAGKFYHAYTEKTGVSGLGLDQNAPLAEAVKDLGGTVTLQGNLDPELLLAGGKALEDGIRSILKTAGKTPFIFNLGHGVIKETPPENVARLAEIIRAHHRQ